MGDTRKVQVEYWIDFVSKGSAKGTKSEVRPDQPNIRPRPPWWHTCGCIFRTMPCSLYHVHEYGMTLIVTCISLGRAI